MKATVAIKAMTVTPAVALGPRLSASQGKASVQSDRVASSEAKDSNNQRSHDQENGQGEMICRAPRSISSLSCQALRYLAYLLGCILAQLLLVL